MTPDSGSQKEIPLGARRRGEMESLKMMLATYFVDLKFCCIWTTPPCATESNMVYRQRAGREMRQLSRNWDNGPDRCPKLRQRSGLLSNIETTVRAFVQNWDNGPDRCPNWDNGKSGEIRFRFIDKTNSQLLLVARFLSYNNRQPGCFIPHSIRVFVEYLPEKFSAVLPLTTTRKARLWTTRFANLSSERPTSLLRKSGIWSILPRNKIWKARIQDTYFGHFFIWRITVRSQLLEGFSDM